MAKHSKSTKTAFIVGDFVVCINLGPLTGVKGEVVQVKGLFNEKYVLKLESGKLTPPLAPRFLTRDKSR